MKKITFVLTSLISIFTIKTAQSADSYKYTPYIGAEYAFNHISVDGNNFEFNSGTLHLGSDYSRYFGTELFYAQSLSDKKSFGTEKLKSSYRAYGLDLMGYLPLDCFQRFYLIGTTGVGEYVFKQKIIGQKQKSDSGYGYRFGAGLKYNITKNWQTRFITRYINYDKISNFNHATEYSFGVEYHF